MKYEISIDQLPSKNELATLFAQTTWASERQIQDIAKMLENLDVFVTIRKDSELIGFGRAISDGIFRALIDDVIVDKAHQKGGLGKLIMENLLQQLDGIEELFLNTSPELEEFYKMFGFKKADSLTMKK